MKGACFRYLAYVHHQATQREGDEQEGHQKRDLVQDRHAENGIFINKRDLKDNEELRNRVPVLICLFTWIVFGRDVARARIDIH